MRYLDVEGAGLWAGEEKNRFIEHVSGVSDIQCAGDNGWEVWEGV